MAKEKEPKPEKTYKPIDEKDIASKLDNIVDLLIVKESTMEQITECVNNLNTEYGLKKPAIRSAATILFKRNQEELNEKNEEINFLVKIHKKV